jgi:predicted thioesterase
MAGRFGKYGEIKRGQRLRQKLPDKKNRFKIGNGLIGRRGLIPIPAGRRELRHTEVDMMATIQVGQRGVKEMVVEPKDLASYSGNIGADVLSTPRLVLLMEQAARNAIEGQLPLGKITVGTLIQIRHFAASPLGAKIRAEAELKEIEGRRLLFQVNAYDDFEKVSEGLNERYIVSENKFLDRIRKKMKNPKT